MNKNQMKLSFSALLENVSFARVAVGAFVAQLDPTVEEVSEIQTVISEAVTNAIIHGYEHDQQGEVYIEVKLHERTVEMVVEDKGKGIADPDKAREPLFTTKPEQENSGMGFTIMENFVNNLEVHSQPGKGTRLVLIKHLQANEALYN